MGNIQMEVERSQITLSLNFKRPIVSESEIKSCMADLGEILAVRVSRRMETGDKNNFGFISFVRSSFKQKLFDERTQRGFNIGGISFTATPIQLKSKPSFHKSEKTYIGVCPNLSSNYGQKRDLVEHYRKFGQIEAQLMPATNEGGFGLVVYSMGVQDALEDEVIGDTPNSVFEQRFMEFTESEVLELKKLQEVTEQTHEGSSNEGMSIQEEEQENSTENELEITNQEDLLKNDKQAQYKHLRSLAKAHPFYRPENARVHLFSILYSVKGKPVRVK